MHKYFRAFLLGIQNAMEYRSNYFLNMVSALFPICIQYFLWTAIYQGNHQAVINGYTYQQIIIYTIMANVISRFIRTGFEYEVAEDVKNGGLNKFITKPIDYSLYKFCCFLGQKLITLTVMALIIAGLLIFLVLYFGAVFSAVKIGLFLLSLLLALILNFTFFFIISTSAFWLLEIGFLFEAIRIIIIFLSGGIFPLDIFGKQAVWLSDFLPFKYTINFPVEILNGRLAIGRELEGIVIQVVWIFIFAVLGKLLWSIGTRHYVAVGG